LIDRGASEDLVGLFFLVPTVLLMALGALLGGWASDRFGRRLVTWISEAGAALLVIAVGAVAAAPPSATVLGWLLVLLALVFLAAGAATASLYGLLMQLTEPSIGAMQFCTFMAAINLCYVWSTRLLGFTVERFGYGAGIAIGGVVSLLALPTLLLLAPASPSRAR
jgi:MFS family permease